MEQKAKKTRQPHKFYHEDKIYGFNCRGKNGEKEYYRCIDRRCLGRMNVRLADGKVSVSHLAHTCQIGLPFASQERAKDAALERLRELTLHAEEGDKAVDIVRRLFKELPPETRAVMPEEDRLKERVRRWAKSGGVELVRSTFDDYLVEEGLDAVPPPPPRDPLSTPSGGATKDPVAGPSSASGEPKKPDLIFLKGRGGEKVRVMIDDKIYIWTRDLDKGGSVYRCLESRIGCRVTVKILREEKQYEIRGTHVHEMKTIQTKRRPRPAQGLKLVDEDGRDLGHVDIDNVLTAGEDYSSFNLDYESLPRVDSVPTSVPPRAPVSTSHDDTRDVEEEMPTDTNDFFDDGGAADDDFPMDFDVGPEVESVPVPVKESTKSRTVPTSSIVKKSPRERRKDAVKSGEKCFVCGDDLIVSETLSSSEETFRKACCYLNVKTNKEWFPRRSDGQFYSFCESCTNEVTRIHQLYKKIEDIQSVIFKKVEHVEKRIANAEIVDNWMAEAPAMSAIRFEGFRQQVLINYRNKLRLRREIRVGTKMGYSLMEIQPVSSAHMFASNPAETDAFRKIAPMSDSEVPTESVHNSQPPTGKKRRGRPKSRHMNRSSEVKPLCSSLEDSVLEASNVMDCADFIGFDAPHDDAVSVTSERETKFWEEDPSRLQVNQDKNDNTSDNGDDNDCNDANLDHGDDNDGGNDNDGPRSENESDPDYNVDDDDDEDWGAPSTRRSKGQGKGRRRGRPQTKTTASTSKTVVEKPKSWAERFAEARAARAAKAKIKQNANAEKPQAQEETKSKPAKSKSKPHRSGDFVFPDAVLAKDGRVFLSGIEIIKNPPGAYKRRPYSISFTCGTCGKIINSFWRMKQHICGHHLGMWNCNKCNKQYSEPKTLLRHNELKHSDKTSTHSLCPICEKPIRDPKNLRFHRWTHLGEEEKKDPQYKSYCPPAKKDPNRIKSSYGLQTFMCSFCPKTYFRTDALRKHEMVHTGDAPTFQCQFCGRQYNTRKSFYGHSLSCASREKPEVEVPATTYPCPKCPVRFKTRGTRSKHIRRFHRNVTDASLPFSCPKCPRRFSTRSGFKMHKKVCVEGQSAASGNRSTRSRNNKNQDTASPGPSRSSAGNQEELFGTSIQKFETGEANSANAIGGNQSVDLDNSSNSSSVPSSSNPNTAPSFLGGFGYNMFGTYQGGNIYQPHQSHQHQ